MKLRVNQQDTDLSVWDVGIIVHCEDTSSTLVISTKNKGYEMDSFVYLGSAIYPSIEEYNDIL